MIQNTASTAPTSLAATFVHPFLQSFCRTKPDRLLWFAPLQPCTGRLISPYVCHDWPGVTSSMQGHGSIIFPSPRFRSQSASIAPTLKKKSSLPQVSLPGARNQRTSKHKHFSAPVVATQPVPSAKRKKNGKERFLEQPPLRFVELVVTSSEYRPKPRSEADDPCCIIVSMELV